VKKNLFVKLLAPSRPWLIIVIFAAALICGCGESVDEAEVRRHVDWLQTALEQNHAANWHAQWQSFTTGKQVQAVYKPGKSLPYFEVGNFWMWRGQIEEPQLGRSVELLYRHTVEAQFSFDPVIAKLTETVFSRHQAIDAGLAQVVRFDSDRNRRRAAWLAQHADPGGFNAEQLTRLFRRRNSIARSLGFKSYYELAMDVRGLRTGRTERLLKKLERASRNAAGRSIDEIARILPDQTVRPWDTELTCATELQELRPHLDSQDLLIRIGSTLADLGLPLDSSSTTVLTLAAGPGKQMFLTFPVRAPNDVRLLLTPADGLSAYQEAFNECGLATYYSRVVQPDFARRLPPNRAVVGGFSRIFAQLPAHPSWLQRYTETPEELAGRIAACVSTHELLQVRRLLAAHAFERAAYKNPDQDLDALYVSLMEQLTSVSWHGAASAWAADLHLATQPFANLDGLLARLIQAQVEETARERHGSIVANPAAGQLLVSELVHPGSSPPWEEIILRATGSRLSERSYVERLQAE
jgi:peptidyl-dipeptidase A